MGAFDDLIQQYAQPTQGQGDVPQVGNVPGGPADRAMIGRIAGQIPQGINESLYSLASMPGDAAAWLLKQAGLRDQNAPAPGEAMRGSLAPALGTQPVDSVPSTPEEKTANAFGHGVGDVFGALAPGGLIARATKGGSMLNTIANAFRTAPIQQAAYTGAGNAVGAATDDPLIGAATAMALPVLAHGAQRTVSAAPAATTQEAERRGLLEYGRQFGAMPTSGNITGRPWLQTLESWLEKVPLPGVGGKVGEVQAQNRNAWQNAILKTAGAEGETAATPNVVERLVNNAGDKIEKAIKGQEINIDPKFGEDIAKAKADFSKQLLDQMPPSITKKLDELVAMSRARGTMMAGPDGVSAPVENALLDGETFQNIRSKLSAMSATAKGNDRHTIGTMIDALDNLAERSLPKDVVGDYVDARRLYRNAVTIRNSVESANNAETGVGNIPTARFSKESRGNPDQQRLGQYGAVMVGDKAENTSKTARHNILSHILSGGAGAMAGHGAGIPIEQMAKGAAAMSVPYGLALSVDNPLTRALLMSRYRNPSAPFTPAPVYGSLAGQQALQQTGGP